MLPSPEGGWAIIEHRNHIPYEYGYEYYYSNPRLSSVWDLRGEIPTLMWTQPDRTLGLSWSGDGARLALGGSDLRVVTGTGELIYERRVQDLELEELPDEPGAQPGSQ